jgi:hypothetical protein
MGELLSKLTGAEVVGLFAVVGGFLFGAVVIIVGIWHHMRLAEMKAVLIQLMLEKGMSAAEIEQVLRAAVEFPWKGIGQLKFNSARPGLAENPLPQPEGRPPGRLVSFRG